MTPSPRRRILLIAIGVLLEACTSPGGSDAVSPTSTVVTTVADTTAAARDSPSVIWNPPATIPGSRGRAPTTPATAVSTAAVAATTSRGPATRSPAPLPSGTGRPLTPLPTVETAVWQRLRRPLKFPAIGADVACPKAEGRNVASTYGPALGNGPVYAVGLGTAAVLRNSARQEGGWSYQKVLFTVAPEYSGPVLIRGHQLDGPYDVRFDEGAAPPPELQLPPAVAGVATWRNYPSSVRFRAPGCYAWQIDGVDFSEIVIFQVVP